MANKIKYIHLRAHYLFEDENTPDPYGGATIAYSVNGNEVEYGIARCYFKDRFNKKIGRAVSASRVTSKKIKLSNVDNSIIVKTLIDAFYCEEEALHGNEDVRLNVY